MNAEFSEPGGLDFDRAIEMTDIEMEAAAGSWTQSFARNVTIDEASVQSLRPVDLAGALDGRHISAKLTLEGERSGESYLLLAERDAHAMAGLFSMMPVEEIRNRSEQPFAWDDFDAFGEIMNQMAGAARVLLAERLKSQYELRPDAVSAIDPSDPQALTGTFGDREVIAVRYRFVIDGYVDAAIYRLFSYKLTETFRGPDSLDVTPTIMDSVHEQPAPEPFDPDGSPTTATAAHMVDSFKGVAEMLGESARKVLETQTFATSEAETAAPAELDSEFPEELNRILRISLPVRVKIASKPMNIRDVLNLSSGALIEFSRPVDAPLSLEVDGRVIAEGRAVVTQERFALELSNVLPVSERIHGEG